MKKAQINGYSIIFRRMENGKESERCIPMVIENEDVNKAEKENPLIEFGIKKLKENKEN